MLMDLFFACAEVPRKRRIHFLRQRAVLHEAQKREARSFWLNVGDARQCLQLRANDEGARREYPRHEQFIRRLRRGLRLRSGDERRARRAGRRRSFCRAAARACRRMVNSQARRLVPVVNCAWAAMARIRVSCTRSSAARACATRSWRSLARARTRSTPRTPTATAPPRPTPARPGSRPAGRSRWSIRVATLSAVTVRPYAALSPPGRGRSRGRVTPGGGALVAGQPDTA